MAESYIACVAILLQSGLRIDLLIGGRSDLTGSDSEFSIFYFRDKRQETRDKYLDLPSCRLLKYF